MFSPCCKRYQSGAPAQIPGRQAPRHGNRIPVLSLVDLCGYFTGQLAPCYLRRNFLHQVQVMIKDLTQKCGRGRIKGVLIPWPHDCCSVQNGVVSVWKQMPKRRGVWGANWRQASLGVDSWFVALSSLTKTLDPYQSYISDQSQGRFVEKDWRKIRRMSRQNSRTTLAWMQDSNLSTFLGDKAESISSWEKVPVPGCCPLVSEMAHCMVTDVSLFVNWPRDKLGRSRTLFT